MNKQTEYQINETIDYFLHIACEKNMNNLTVGQRWVIVREATISLMDEALDRIDKMVNVNTATANYMYGKKI